MKNTRQQKEKTKANAELKKDTAVTYNEFKIFEGKQYTSMKIERSHKWNYEAGVWKEKKITPDKWEIESSANKKKVAKASESSGVTLGTESIAS